MLKTFRRLVKLNLDDLWLYIGVEGGLFLLIQIIIGCVMYFGRPDSSVTISCILFPIVGGFVALVAGISHVGVSFEQALRFGQTRRRALGLTLGLMAFQSAFALALAAVLAAAERFLCVPLWARLAGMKGWAVSIMGPIAPEPVEGLVSPTGTFFVNTTGELMPLAENTLLINSFTLDWYWWLLIFAVAIVGGTIIGAVVQRFGSKGFWLIWVLCVGPSLLSQILPWETWSLSSWTAPLVILAAVVCLGFVWSLWSLLHAVVRS